MYIVIYSFVYYDIDGNIKYIGNRIIDNVIFTDIRDAWRCVDQTATYYGFNHEHLLRFNPKMNITKNGLILHLFDNKSRNYEIEYSIYIKELNLYRK